MSLIKREKRGNKDIIVYNTLFRTSVMKRHKHLELLTTYVEKVVVININSKSQTTYASGGCRAMHHAKKTFQSSSKCNFNFFGAKLLTKSWMRFKNYS
jgi:hypothetical protein